MFIMKYNVGDKVMIKKDLIEKYIRYGIPTNDIKIYEGKEAIITRANEHENNYNINIDKGRWVWAPYQIEDVINEKCYSCKKFNTCDKKRCI